MRTYLPLTLGGLLMATASAHGGEAPFAFPWWRYNDVDAAVSPLDIADTTAPTARLRVPDEPGKTLRLIPRITDRGSPPLTRYPRLILTIAE